MSKGRAQAAAPRTQRRKGKYGDRKQIQSSNSNKEGQQGDRIVGESLTGGVRGGGPDVVPGGQHLEVLLALGALDQLALRAAGGGAEAGAKARVGVLLSSDLCREQPPREFVQL